MRSLLAPVYSTRAQARAFVTAHADVDPDLPVYVRADVGDHPATEIKGLPIPASKGVQIMSPTFAHELRKLWPKAQLVGANPEVEAAWELADRPAPQEETTDEG